MASHIRLEILPQFPDRDEPVRLFPVQHMTVVAFAALVIVSNDAFPAATVVQPVLEAVGPIGRRARQAPDDYFDDAPTLKPQLLIEQQRCLAAIQAPDFSCHMAYNTIA